MATETKEVAHTAGPWEVWGGTRIVTSRPRSLNVAEVSGRMPDEGQANARLISAAPELLAVLKRADETLRMIPPPLSDCYTNGLQPDIAAAIAKAEGER